MAAAAGADTLSNPANTRPKDPESSNGVGDDKDESPSDARDAVMTTYPSGLSLTFIVVVLILSIFLAVPGHGECRGSLAAQAARPLPTRTSLCLQDHRGDGDPEDHRCLWRAG